jgi:hypothetical protein
MSIATRWLQFRLMRHWDVIRAATTFWAESPLAQKVTV